MVDFKQTTVHNKVGLQAAATRGSSTTHLFQHPKQKQAAKLFTMRHTKLLHLSPKQPMMISNMTKMGPVKMERCPYIQWKRPDFIHMQKNFSPRYVLSRSKYFAQTPLPHLYNCTHEPMTGWGLTSLQQTYGPAEPCSPT